MAISSVDLSIVDIRKNNTKILELQKTLMIIIIINEKERRRE